VLFRLVRGPAVCFGVPPASAPYGDVRSPLGLPRSQPGVCARHGRGDLRKAGITTTRRVPGFRPIPAARTRPREAAVYLAAGLVQWLTASVQQRYAEHRPGRPRARHSPVNAGHHCVCDVQGNRATGPTDIRRNAGAVGGLGGYYEHLLIRIYERHQQTRRRL